MRPCFRTRVRVAKPGGLPNGRHYARHVAQFELSDDPKAAWRRTNLCGLTREARAMRACAETRVLENRLYSLRNAVCEVQPAVNRYGRELADRPLQQPAALLGPPEPVAPNYHIDDQWARHRRIMEAGGFEMEIPELHQICCRLQIRSLYSIRSKQIRWSAG
jgi:hypothetical protein